MVCMNKNRGFSLVELLVVMAIIGILATIAIPSYKVQTIRGYVADGINDLYIYKSQIMEYYTIKGSVPASLPGINSGGTGTATPVSNGDTVLAGVWTQTDGTNFWVWSQFSSSDPRVTSIAGLVVGIKAAPNGTSLTWTCGTGSNPTFTMPIQYLPSSCQNTL